MKRHFFYKCIAAYLKIYNAYTPKRAIHLTLLGVEQMTANNIAHALNIIVNHARYELKINPIIRSRMNAVFFNKIIIGIVDDFIKKNPISFKLFKTEDGIPFNIVVKKVIDSNRYKVVDIVNLGRNIFGVFSPNVDSSKIMILAKLLTHIETYFRAYFYPNKLKLCDLNQMLNKYTEK